REPMHRARLEVEERRPRDHLLAQDGLARFAQLELRASRLHVPGLLLDAVELEAERFAGSDEEGLPDVAFGLGPDQLPPPRLLDAPRLDGPPVDADDVPGLEAHAGTGRSSGCARTKSSASRSCFGVFTVSQKLGLR